MIRFLEKAARRVGSIHSTKILRATIPAALLALESGTAADTLYFADIFQPPSAGAIRKIGPSGAGLQTILKVNDGLRGIAVDQANGHIYFTMVEPPSVQRCKLDGSDQQSLVTPAEWPSLAFPFDIALDLENNKMFWGDLVAQQVLVANLDGSNPQVIHDTPIHRGPELDDVNDKLYWSTATTGRQGEIVRSNTDGTSVEIVVTSEDPEFKPAALALDIAEGKIYWTDYVLDVVRRSNLDGSDIQTLYAVGANNNPNGIALDLDHGKVYWGQDVDSQLQIGSIMRMNLDGGSPETVLNRIGSIPSLFLTLCVADIAPAAGNSSVNVDDLLVVINAWGPCADANVCPADIDPSPTGDGVVDRNDLIAIIDAWGQCP